MQLIGKALELEPENGYFIDSLGWAYYQQGRYPEALARAPARRGEGAGRSGPVIYDHLGDAFAKNGLRRRSGRRVGAVAPARPAADGVKKKLEEISATVCSGSRVSARRSLSSALSSSCSAAALARWRRPASPARGGTTRRRARCARAGTSSPTSARSPRSSIDRGRREGQFTGVLLLKAPDSLRFEALSPFGQPLSDRHHPRGAARRLQRGHANGRGGRRHAGDHRTPVRAALRARRPRRSPGRPGRAAAGPAGGGAPAADARAVAGDHRGRSTGSACGWTSTAESSHQHRDHRGRYEARAVYPRAADGPVSGIDLNAAQGD